MLYYIENSHCQYCIENRNKINFDKFSHFINNNYNCQFYTAEVSSVQDLDQIHLSMSKVVKQTPSLVYVNNSYAKLKSIPSFEFPCISGRMFDDSRTLLKWISIITGIDNIKVDNIDKDAFFRSNSNIINIVEKVDDREEIDYFSSMFLSEMI